METINIDDWESFESLINERIIFLNQKSNNPVSPILFRGQNDTEWGLQTTLERYIPSRYYQMSNYYSILRGVNPIISSMSKQTYEVDDHFSYNGLIAPPAYDLMVYLRHHGFPSPLLDWTRSFYIAAFFAFWGAKKSERISIFCFKEYVEGYKSWSSNSPHIMGLGPYLRTHPRHHVQQAEYTICVLGDKKDPKYVSHDSSIFGSNQDSLVKFTLPTSIRKKVLSKLDEMNINAFSLFNNEEGLLDMLAFREIQ